MEKGGSLTEAGGIVITAGGIPAAQISHGLKGAAPFIAPLQRAAEALEGKTGTVIMK